MKLLQRVLLIPSLLPLLVVLVLSALHRGEPTRLHLLGWSSPEAPLGVWTALAATGSAALAASSALFLMPSQQPCDDVCIGLMSLLPRLIGKRMALINRIPFQLRPNAICAIQLQQWP